MSTGQQQSSSSTDAIRDEVRRTIKSLGDLARTERNFDDFCNTVLTNVVKITGAHNALFWQVNGNRVPRLTHQQGTFPHESARALTTGENPRHSHALLDVVSKQQPMGVPSDAFYEPGSQEQEHARRDASFLMLFSPVYDRSENCCGTLELLQRGDISPQAREGYLRFLNQVAQLFQRWHEQHDLERLSRNADQWQDRLKFISETHRSIDPKETSYAIANEARRLLHCDRVSVARWTGQRCKMLAISSQDRFDNRANVVRLLSNVATASVSSDTRFWVTGDTEGLAPEVARKINDYLDESHSRTLVVIPLMARPPQLPDLEMQSRRRQRPRKLGALVLEYFDADVTEPEIEDDCKLIVEQAELALDNARKHNEIFLQPVLKRMGWLQKTLFRDHLSKTLTGLAIIAAIVLALIFVPYELRMKVDGVMQPTVRKTVFSRESGEIVEVLIDQHDDVRAGQPMIRLKTDDIDAQIRAMEAESETLGLQAESQQKQSFDTTLSPAERQQLVDNAEISRRKQLVTEKQLDVLKRKRSYYTLNSPIDGTVVTPRPRERYEKKIITPDLALIEVADLTGEWQLELKIPEGKIGYIDEARTASNGEPLGVDFKIGTDPNLTLEGRLVDIGRRAVPSEAGVAEFRAVVEIDQAALQQLQNALRSGAGATARIRCGKRSLGFVCFYQVIDYVRTQWFF